MTALALSACALALIATAYADRCHRRLQDAREALRATRHRADRAEREVVMVRNAAAREVELVTKALAEANRWRRVAEHREAN